jgi:hypothetical protein
LVGFQAQHVTSRRWRALIFAECGKRLRLCNCELRIVQFTLSLESRFDGKLAEYHKALTMWTIMGLNPFRA